MRTATARRPDTQPQRQVPPADRSLRDELVASALLLLALVAVAAAVGLTMGAVWLLG